MALIRRKYMFPYDRDSFMAVFSGSEAGLATTTGIIAGLMVDEISRNIVVTTAMISFIVQAFNSAAGRFADEHTDDEIDNEDSKNGYRLPITHASFQFSAHILMSLVVISPIIFISDRVVAGMATVLTTIIFLFLIGAFKGKIVKKSPLKDGLELALVGFLVTLIGLLAGVLLRL